MNSLVADERLKLIRLRDGDTPDECVWGEVIATCLGPCVSVAARCARCGARRRYEEQAEAVTGTSEFLRAKILQWFDEHTCADGVIAARMMVDET